MKTISKLITIVISSYLCFSCVSKGYDIQLQNESISKLKIFQFDCSSLDYNFSLSIQHLDYNRFQIKLLRGKRYIIESPFYESVDELKKDKEFRTDFFVNSFSEDLIVLEITLKNKNIIYFYKPIYTKNCE